MNFTSPEGKDIFYKLIIEADVIVTNLRLCEIEKFKVDYQTLRKINPCLIYGALIVYGKNDPDKDMRAYDTTSFRYRSPTWMASPGST